MSADTKTKILEVARRLFHEQGYHATGIATILREANVNSGSLYYFFPSKEELLVGVLKYYVELLRPMVMDPAEAATADPIERVFALLANYRLGLEMTGCTMGCPIGNLALEVGDNYPEIRKLIDLNFHNWAAVVRGWLEAAGERLPADVNRGELAQFVLTVMEGGIMQSRAAGTLAPYDASVRQLREYFERLQAAAGAAPPGKAAQARDADSRGAGRRAPGAAGGPSVRGGAAERVKRPRGRADESKRRRR